jgi:hypothetical protein
MATGAIPMKKQMAMGMNTGNVAPGAAPTGGKLAKSMKAPAKPQKSMFNNKGKK